MPYDEKGQFYGTPGQLSPGGSVAAGTSPLDTYKQLAQLRSDQASSGGKYGGIQSWNVSDMPEFQKLDPSTQSAVKQAGEQFVAAMPKDSGWGSFLSALAIPAAVSVGLPGLLSGGADWGVGSGIMANAAGAGVGAGAAGAGGGVPAGASVSGASDFGFNAALSPADAAAYQEAIANPAASIDLGLGAGAGAALGVSSPTGTPAIPGTTPAGAAAGGAPAASGATTPAATGGAAGGAAGSAAATTPQSFMDNLLGQLKKNALSLGIMGASIAGAGAVGQKPMPGQETLNQLGGMSADVAKQYLSAAQSGNLTAPQQAQLDQYVQQAKNQVRQYFASIGQENSSSRMQAEQQVDQTALAMKQQILQQTLTSGLQALGVAEGPLNTVAQYQLGQDQALQQALGRFATGAGLLAGSNAGTTAKTAATTP